MKIHDRVLLVFSDDLRVHDNPTLNYASDIAVSLGCVFCKDLALKTCDQFGLKRSSLKRARFLEQSLHDLQRGLSSLGQSLHIVEGNTETEVLRLIESEQAGAVVYTEQAGVYEKNCWSRIRERAPHVAFHCINSFTLLQKDQLPFGETFPDSFSKFRRQVEKLDIAVPQAALKSLPRSFLKNANAPSQKPASLEDNAAQGGESAALAHLEHYFTSEAPLQYKQTRNELDGWANSTKFSFWLANGSLSVRTLYHRLKQYEEQHGANESTYWIFFELLWREFFQWYAHYYEDRLFHFGGVKSKSPLTSFYPERFKKWCQGRTPWPLVNACMQQLNKSGYMSNRGRQIVASALINELQLDWRCGAAYFEQELLDYDVASNWGNWQYIAGVGADPRGGRHFNIEKQHEQYDKDNRFVNTWTDHSQPITAIDSVDAVDWPVE